MAWCSMKRRAHFPAYCHPNLVSVSRRPSGSMCLCSVTGVSFNEVVLKCMSKGSQLLAMYTLGWPHMGALICNYFRCFYTQHLTSYLAVQK